jgi:hypothetical protein
MGEGMFFSSPAGKALQISFLFSPNSEKYPHMLISLCAVSYRQVMRDETGALNLRKHYLKFSKTRMWANHSYIYSDKAGDRPHFH